MSVGLDVSGTYGLKPCRTNATEPSWFAFHIWLIPSGVKCSERDPYCEPLALMGGNLQFSRGDLKVLGAHVLWRSSRTQMRDALHERGAPVAFGGLFGFQGASGEPPSSPVLPMELPVSIDCFKFLRYLVRPI